MFASVTRRLGLAALMCFSVAACHRSEDTPPSGPASASTVRGAFAATSTDPAKTARETAVAQLIQKKYPRLSIQRLDEVDTGGQPVYYLMASSQVFYTNDKVDYLIEGGQLIIGVGDKVRNVTQEMGQKLVTTIYQRLPLEQAVKKVYGKGERQMVVFSDPDCPVCQAFETVLEQKGADLNATVYTFPLPVIASHPDSVRKASYLLCTSDPGAAWHDWMIHAGEDSKGWDAWAAQNKSEEGCKRAELAAVGTVLARDLGIIRTPTVILPNGNIVSGAPDLARLESLWAQPSPEALLLPGGARAKN